MNLIIHRGTEQIGGNCIELSTKNTRIILDIGQELPTIGEGKPKELSNLPKVESLYKNESKGIDAILISHGHNDHSGLIEFVNRQIPIFIGEKALKILNITSKFTGHESVKNTVNYLMSGKEFAIGDFLITPYLVDHSGFDAYAFVIKADNKCIVYTGDFRGHGRKKKATDYFRYNIPKDIDALIIEGTMMSRVDEKIETEEDIEKKAIASMKTKETPIFVLQSSTNIDRLVGMYKAARSSGRIFVMDIFTAHIVSQLNDNIPNPGKFKDVRVFYPYNLTKRMFNEPEEERLMKEFSQYKISKKELGCRKDYCMLIRDSMLSDLQHIKNLRGASLIYSMWNGYKKQERVKRLLNYARLNNMNIVNLHTSGHASIETLQKIIISTKPNKTIPIHTEAPQLFKDKFKKVYIAKDREVISV